ncbi:ABC transporter ATP-binding protein [Paenibacillus camerounensis]|uniref:ABC transporter ATP-binding protein n=1 Tax=Paenibacillus camerounensis TaxID=1243663 RepID=UPI0005A78D9B|nr:ABC transporter ATP-binding protein [Paenibacillus camerounensis]
MRKTIYTQMKPLWPIIRRYRWSFINLFICVVVTSVIGMVYPYIFGMLIDEVFYQRNFQFLKYIVILYGTVFAGEQCLHICFNSAWAYLATRFSFDIRKTLYDKLLSLRPAFFTASKSGDLMTIINRDTEEVLAFIHLNVFFLAANILRLLTAVAFVLYASFYLGLLMLVAVPAVVFVTVLFNRRLRTRLTEQREQYGSLMSWCFEMLAGLQDIRLLGAGKYSSRTFVHLIIQYMRVKNSSSKLEWISERTVGLISLCSDLALYITACYLIIHQQLTLGVFIASMEYFSKGGELLQRISGASRSIQRNKVAIDRVISLLQEPEENKGLDLPGLRVTKGNIEFDNVSFSYNPETPVLQNLSLVLEGGTTVALVGKSGSGKTTLASLLLGLYKPDSGEIRVDGTPISGCSLRSLHRAVGTTAQETFLFEGTLRENLLWGSVYQKDKALWTACEKAFISEYIRTLPEGMDTLIEGEQGLRMSEGQKQRISLARSFLRSAPIIIYDEATSGLDGEAEKAVRAQWHNLSGSRTAIVIAHRLSTILSADKVAVLDNGKIIAYDHHLRLLSDSEVYRRLFYEQYAENGLGRNHGEPAAQYQA